MDKYRGGGAAIGIVVALVILYVVDWMFPELPHDPLSALVPAAFGVATAFTGRWIGGRLGERATRESDATSVRASRP